MVSVHVLTDQGLDVGAEAARLALGVFEELDVLGDLTVEWYAICHVVGFVVHQC